MSQTLNSHEQSSAIRPPEAGASPLSQLAGQAKFWRKSAPTDAKKDPTSKDSAWMQYLSTRRSPKPLIDLCQASSNAQPLAWALEMSALETSHLEAPTQRLLKLVAQKPGKRLTGADAAFCSEVIEHWFSELAELPQTVDFAVSTLALTHLLPRLAGAISGQQWWELVDSLYEIATSAETWQPDLDQPPEVSLCQQLLGGELPLTLAYFFPEIAPLHKLKNLARVQLTTGTDSLLNGEGLVHGSLLTIARPLLACWTRCAAIGSQFKKSAWSSNAATQFGCALTHALRWSSASGQQLLARETGVAVAWDRDFLATAIDLAGDAADRNVASSALGTQFYKPAKQPKSKSEPTTSEECEWAGVALLRTGWNRQAAVVAVDYSSDYINLEVNAAGRTLFCGVWDVATEADGRALQPTGEWEQVCWLSDDAVDYLELSIELAGGGTLERQVMLAREDQVLLLADNLKRPGAKQIEHRWQLPLSDQVSYQQEKETREATLITEKPVARVLPLALAEWRLDPRGGELTSESNMLVLTQQQAGSALCAPLLIDLKAPRANKPCTWRQLTVAESLEIVPRDVAVAFRAQCGKQQWVFYRSLSKPANRTFIGQNVSSECYAGKFLPPPGEMHELLEIEG